MNAVKESDRAVSKQIRVLENRLDKALVKFNEALAFNKQVRLSDTMYLLIGFRKSTPPQNRQPNTLISDGKQ